MMVGGVSKDALLNGPQWKKFTVPYSSFTAAGTSQAITLFSLAPKQIIRDVIAKHSVAFAGGSIATYTVSVGIVGNLTKYIGNFNVKQAVSDAASSNLIAAAPTVESFANPTVIQINAISTVDNLSNATAGSVDIWILVDSIE